MCVGEAGRAVTQLVREAAGLPKQKSLTTLKEDRSPRSESSSLQGSNSSGTSFVRTLRELFAAGTYRQQPDPVADGLPGRPFQWRGAKLHEKWGDYDYDEDLQEDLFLERVFYPMPIKNTFIHYKTDDGEEKEWKSSPAKLLATSFHTKYPNHEDAHYQGKCRPCAYHLYKIDGCRWGYDCQFCHLCKRGEIKKRKREKARAMRQARADRQAAALAAAGGDTPSCINESELGDALSSDSDKSETQRGEEARSPGA